MNISAFNRLSIPQIRFFPLIIRLALLPLLILGIVAEINAANSVSEKHWAGQLRDKIVIGESVDLPLTGAADGESTFFAIFTPHTTSQPKGAVILMHGTQAHPDWREVIHPLRIGLPDKGWATLSIQLPLTLSANNSEQVQEQEKKEAEQTQLIEASVFRIDAAINFLKAKTYHPIVIISHSEGSLMALNFLQLKMGEKPAQNPDGTRLISGAIIIGTPSSGTSIPLNSPAMIEKIKIPLLDLYGSIDLDNVQRTAKARKTAAHKAGNRQYRQVKTIGANHFYNGLDNELLTYVSGWLNKNIARNSSK